MIENSEDYWILEEANQVAEKWNISQNPEHKKVVLVTIDTKNRNAWIETSTEVQKYISNRDAMNMIGDVEEQLIGEKYDTAVSYILEQTNVENSQKVKIQHQLNLLKTQNLKIPT